MKMFNWLILTHQLPAHPSNVRVKVWRKLRDLGSIPIKNSIYVLPNNAECREDFEWLRKEIIQMKGEASVFCADLVNPAENREIVQTFQKIRSKDFAALMEKAAKFTMRFKSLLQGGYVKMETFMRAEKEWQMLKAEWERLQKIDFFEAPNRSKTKALMASGQKQFEQAKALLTKDIPKPLPPVDPKSLKGHVWVTREFPHSDRLASAWLIRKYIDPAAQFKFVSEPYKSRSREICFDMYEAEFTHFGDWCTFETLVSRIGIKEYAVLSMAEMIHDIDLKDNKYKRMESPGIGKLIHGLCSLYKGNDPELLKAGINLFGALYASLREKEIGTR